MINTMNFVFRKLALLLIAALPTYALGAGDARFAEKLKTAQAHLANNQYIDAIAACRAGLAQLGDAYHSPFGVDDTGMALALAESLERQGKLEMSAKLTCQTLDSRMSLLQYKTAEGKTSPAQATQKP